MKLVFQSIIFICLISSQYVAAKDDAIFKVYDSPSRSLAAAELRWPVDNIASFPKHGIGNLIWQEGKWGDKYLIKAFGLENYLTNINSVFQEAGQSEYNEWNDFEHMTHYIPHKNRKKMCVIKFHYYKPKGKNEAGYERIEALLMGCHEISKP